MRLALPPLAHTTVDPSYLVRYKHVLTVVDADADVTSKLKPNTPDLLFPHQTHTQTQTQTTDTYTARVGGLGDDVETVLS